jgi:hypothetical protein
MLCILGVCSFKQTYGGMNLFCKGVIIKLLQIQSGVIKEADLVNNRKNIFIVIGVGLI